MPQSTAASSGPTVARRAVDYLGLSRRDRRPDADTTGDYGKTVAKLHDDEREVGPLNAEENRRLHRIKIFGATGSILLLIGSLGTGQLPVLQNPVAGMRVLSLPSRMWSTALTLSIGGTIMLVVAWLLIGRFVVGRYSVEVLGGRSPQRRMTRKQADRTLLLWIAPVLVAPPLLSKDVYSYLAQSAIAYRGMDPFQVSPVRGLGIDHELARSVPNLWRDTPAPYGPFFLWIGEGITAITGENITAGIFLHRLVALVGLALIVWALPRLARRCGVSAVAALWLGALNPLVILHLVGGIHNDALMIGLMLVGMELAFRAIYGTDRLRLPGSIALPSRSGWLLIAGATLIALSALVKVSSLVAMGFVGIALALRWGATLPALRHAPASQWWGRSRRSIIALGGSASLLAAVLIVVMFAVRFGSGLGFGWIGTLSTGDVVRSWMSMPTLLSVSTGQVGIWLGLGDQTQAILDVVRPLGQLVAGVFVVRWMLAALARRVHPLGALGVAMATIVMLLSFVHAWYLLWAIIPLAAWATRPWFRLACIAISAIIAIVVMPTSSNTSGVVLAQGLLASFILVAVLVALFFEDTRIGQWRKRDGSSAADPSSAVQKAENPAVETSAPKPSSSG